MDAGEEQAQDLDSARILSAWMIGRHGPAGEEERTAPLEKHEMSETFSTGRPFSCRYIFGLNLG